MRAIRILSFSVSAVILAAAQLPGPSRVDERLEALQILMELRTSRERPAIESAHYLSIKNHPVLRMVDSLPKEIRGSTNFHQWILCLGPWPDLKPLCPVPEAVQKAVPPANQAAFLAAFQDFAPRAWALLVTDGDRLNRYRKLSAQVNARLDPGMRHMKRLAGVPVEGVEVVFIDDFISGGVAVLETGSSLKPRLTLLANRESHADEVEAMWSWLIPAVLRYQAQVLLQSLSLPRVPQTPGRRWLKELQRVNPRFSSTWEDHVRASLDKAIYIRVLEALGQPELIQGVQKDASANLPWVPRLVSRWLELERTQGMTLTIKEAMSDLLRVFEDEDPVTTVRTRMVGVRAKHITTP